MEIMVRVITMAIFFLPNNFSRPKKTEIESKNPIFLPKKVLSEKMGFFRSKSVRIQFF